MLGQRFPWYSWLCDGSERAVGSFVLYCGSVRIIASHRFIVPALFVLLPSKRVRKSHAVSLFDSCLLDSHWHIHPPKITPTFNLTSYKFTGEILRIPT